MLLLTDDVNARLASPDNLINRLRRLDNAVYEPVLVQDNNEPNQMLVNTADEDVDIIIDSILRVNQPFVSRQDSRSATEPSLDDLLPNGLDKIKSNLAQTTALEVMQESLDNLKYRLHEVDTPKELSRIAQDMSKIIGNLKPKDDDNRRQGNIIIYKPTVADVSQYKSVVVNE